VVGGGGTPCSRREEHQSSSLDICTSDALAISSIR
jgi:hypothetical protein